MILTFFGVYLRGRLEELWQPLLEGEEECWYILEYSDYGVVLIHVTLGQSQHPRVVSPVTMVTAVRQTRRKSVCMCVYVCVCMYIFV